MEKIQSILRDLYKIAPELRDREDELKKAINELMASRPSVEMDPEFEKKLKIQLMEKFSEKKERKAFFFWGILSRKFVLRTAGVLAVLVLSLLSVLNYQRFLPLNPKMDKGTIESQTTTTTGNSKTVSHNSGGKGLLNLSHSEPVVKEKDKSEEVLEVPKMENAQGPVSGEQEQQYSPSETRRLVKSEMKKEMIPTDSDDKNKVAEETIDQTETPGNFNTESYDRIYENTFQDSLKSPLSTLSIDVDTASYANVRRIINENSLPNPDAVRIEEMVNYFTYNYQEPTNDIPLAFNTELSECPWNNKHELLLLGIQAKTVKVENLPPNNLVFLVDVSGSMDEPNKLPLIKEALKLLVKQMRPVDRISLVVYAGSAGMVLEPTSGSDKKTIEDALDRLEAGGSTAGSQGLQLAYETAKKVFNPRGNNRVIIATDGDFNVGPSSDGELVRMIEEKRKDGIYLTVLGFGMGNYKDSKMVKMADKGNGNYAYIDTLQEAKKVLVNEMAGTLLTIAKDVKIQIEFNPSVVKEYRLIGYEKRLLQAQDFNDDKKDAGELGAGLSVTVLYEIVKEDNKNEGLTNDLKYQTTAVKSDGAYKDEMMTIKFRYKKPDEDQSRLLTYPIQNKPVNIKKTSDNFRFASSVAEWGLILRDSEFKADADYNQIIEMANGSKGNDPEGYRAEFIKLVKATKDLSKK